MARMRTQVGWRPSRTKTQQARPLWPSGACFPLSTEALSRRKNKKQEGYAVQNKVTVTIDGQEYNLVAAEDAAYMRKVAEHVDA